MKVCALDHKVLCVNDVRATRRFYERVLNMESREERPGKWSLHFGAQKISLQDAVAFPSIAHCSSICVSHVRHSACQLGGALLGFVLVRCIKRNTATPWSKTSVLFQARCTVISLACPREYRR
ncbi:VOC family protein [Sinorhizobium sp. M4_45]|uniref:VOC family protein n=1 Tax=Sinorhizobium sp. M4_45 TaxID=2037901 RepID=UPI0032AF25C8